ncbi:hypothetical protein PWG71_26755 [Nocardiopsis sp. N85]|uniref:hypothetical protein n=1 Tax=Nocardiopsis sp. N85 TaxID=3029400 RepID=UPI00237EED89|nr:hypothetical protein [Nocardiopsis sp. N85]MDE3725001.1 hypothetical protein [Nocardiopsis sp. N85]
MPHVDPRPDDIVLTDAGPVLIDRTNARVGEADLDVSMSALILAQVSLAGTFPPPVRAAAGALPDASPACTDGDAVRPVDEAMGTRSTDPDQTPEETAALTASAARILDRAGSM